MAGGYILSGLWATGLFVGVDLILRGVAIAPRG
jgi:hypothetical protein